MGCAEFFEFQQDFPDYDPDGVADTCAAATSPSPGVAVGRGGRGVRDVLPAPFEWIEIPGKGFSIAKYPLTNAQFARFIEAGGYNEQRFWTEAGWQQRQQDSWTEPRYWQDSKWNGAEQPVVGVSWYEAIAFCQWLGEMTGENITLPTEVQWQYAAQGDDGRKYPWGDGWDCQRCNNSVKPCQSDRTTPVRQYEGKGDSPFGVVDMAGNVWEWCRTDYESGSNEIEGGNMRVLRGGSCLSTNSGLFRCANRGRLTPYYGYDFDGFRVSRS